MSETTTPTPPAPAPAPQQSPEISRANSVMELFDKANRLNIIPLIACAIIGYLFWLSGKENQARLEAAEARTRSALVACSGVSREENSKTRAEVRAKAADLQNAIGVSPPAPAPTPP